MSDLKNNNLETFRAEIRKFLTESGQQNLQNDSLCILCYEQFQQLINHLCNQKLIHPLQVKKILSKIQPATIQDQQELQATNLGIKSIPIEQKTQSEVDLKKKTVSFPLTLKQFQGIMMVEFGDQNCQNLLTHLKKYKTLLKQIKGVLNVWKDKGLSNQQKAELEAIFARGNEKINNLFQQLRRKKEIIENISQQQIQMIKALDEWIQMQKILKKFQDFQDFQKSNKQTINSLFNKLQVKQVHFKKNQSNFKTVTDIYRLRGYNSKNDEPVEVFLIAKNSINFEIINKELIKFDALKQLFLSEHFPKFLGFNTHSSPAVIQYFVESTDSKNLSVIMNSQKVLDISSPLLKYWMYQIYKAFFDLFLMCSYEPLLPIKLEHFEVRDYGLQIVLKNVNFLQKRKKIIDTKIDPLETQLLQNLGTVLLELLRIKPSLSEIDKNLSKLEQKCFFKSLLNVVESHLNYQKSIVDNYLSFFNLQTHPLLQQSQFSDGVEIVENYMAIFGNQ